MEFLRKVYKIESMSKKKFLDKTELQSQLGKRIQELRKQKGLTQEALAEAMDVHPSLIGPIESGKKFPRALTFCKLAGALNVPLHQLWLFEPDVYPKQKAIQELNDLLKGWSEREAKVLLAIGKDLQKLLD